MKISRRAALLTSLALLLVLGGVILYSFLSLRHAMARLDLVVQEVLLANEVIDGTGALLPHVADTIVSQDAASQAAVEKSLVTLQRLLTKLGEITQAPRMGSRLESLRRMTLTCQERSQHIFRLAQDGHITEAVAEKQELERVTHFMVEDINSVVAGELLHYRSMREELSQQAARMAVVIVTVAGAVLLGSFLLLSFAFIGELNKRERLNAELEARVRARSRELEAAQRQLVDTAHLAGRAEVATSVLHNVGNVLTSLNVTVTLAADALGQMPIHNIARTSQLLTQHLEEPGWLRDDPRGCKVPVFLDKLGRALEEERERLVAQLHEMSEHVDHIKQVVAMQNAHAGRQGLAEPLRLDELIELSLRINLGDQERHAVEVVRHFDTLPEVWVEKHKVLQILVNLISNALKALEVEPAAGRRMALRLGWGKPGHWRIEVEDNGVGISPENLGRLFRFGFTTRKGGHGIGLHSSVLAAQEMRGMLAARSDGLGRGATFTLEVPVADVPGRLTANG
jgi:C4-dicarboxylate-specific signal transduction histidine kinase